jgi:hypothetical protein
VHAAQVAETDHALELGEGCLAIGGGAQIVAGGEGVAGVETDADPRSVLDAVDDRREVLEAMTQVGALVRG